MPKIRKGKTLRKRLSGAIARNASNKAARATWGNDNHASNKTFPAATCNGRRNRSIIVIKRNGMRGATSA